MAARTWNWEGVSAGTALTTSNTLSDDSVAPTTSGVNSGTTTIKSTATHYTGTYAVEFYNEASSSSIQRLPFGGSHLQGAVRFYHRISALPNVSLNFATVRHASGNLFRLVITAGNKIQLQTQAGVSIVSSTASYVAAQWNRIEFVYTVASSSTGALTLNVYAGDSLSAYATLTTAVGDLGTATATAIEVGTPQAVGALSSPITQIFDALVTNYGATAEIGPVTNAAPTLSLNASQNLAAGATATITATAADSDGTIVSYDFSIVSATSTSSPSLDVSSNVATFTVPAAGGLVTVQCIVTDDHGSTATATTEVRSLLAGGTASRPVAINGTGDAWVNTGGVGTDGGAQSDESDSTYMLSADVTGAEFKRRYRLQASPARSSAAIKLRLWTESGTANSTVRLIEGVTTRQTWTQALNTTPTEYTFTITTPAAITDWGNLFYEVGVTT